MFSRLFVLVLAAVLLSGCILQSRAPIYDDSDASLVLGDAGGVTRTASRKTGSWENDPEAVPIRPEGNHYVVEGKARIELHFVKLEGDWFVLQARQQQGPAAFLLARVRDKIAEARPLACREVEKIHALESSVVPVGDNCFIREGADPAVLFKAILKTNPEPTVRLSIVPGA